MWLELYEFNNIPMYELLSIIDDATVYGFTFKVENYKIYVKEN